LPAGARPTVSLQRRLDENYLEIGGGIASGAKDFSTRISVARPAELFAALLRQRLIDKGVEVIGGYRYEKRPDGSPPAGTQIAEIESVPLAEIAAKTMKPSQNMYTEVLLRTLGENQRDAIIRSAPDSPEAKKTSAELGLVAVSRFLERIGLPPDAIVQYDGSGLSRHNLITAEAVVRLYEYMSRESRFAKQWRESLTVGGVDGTLRNRYIGTSAAGNVRGKTGTIDQVSALSGYLKTAGGEEVVFSLIVNQMPSAQMRTGLIDEMVVLLADYKGRLTVDGTTPDKPAK
jgi:D-alanyl-D-alanine carboxypeptidase/D-alanyl-D-alanine-endopeptidase (penicillin-binding protein 4)